MSSVANLADASSGSGDQAAPNTRQLVTSIATVFVFQGFAMSINGIGAPFIAKSFNLGESGIATLFAWISISAIGALGLSRMIDRLGRRRMLLVSMAGTSVSALAAAVATNYAAFALCEIALFAIGTTAASSFYDVFGKFYRRRAITVLFCSLLGNIAGIAASSWAYFHLVSVVGFKPGLASGLMLVGGGVGMLGFPLGARGCERYGRIPTIFVASLMTSLGAVAFYWGPPADLPLRWLWIEVTYCCFTAGLSAGQVGGNSLGTELFPTAIRGAMMGWYSLIGAAASITAQTLIAVLATRLGGLSIVVGYLSLLALPNAIIVALTLPETRGLSLEAAAMEEAFEKSH